MGYNIHKISATCLLQFLAGEIQVKLVPEIGQVKRVYLLYMLRELLSGWETQRGGTQLDQESIMDRFVVENLRSEMLMFI